MLLVNGVACAWGLLLALTMGTEAVYVKTGEEFPPQYCTVYTHMLKAGGSSIKQKLLIAAREYGVPKPLFCNQKGASDQACLDAAPNAAVVTGSNVESMRYALNQMGRQCEFFTMMRHPIDRAISAFFYCPEDHDVQNRPPEWCGYSDHPTPVKVRLVGFLKNMWGNKAFRQFSAGLHCSSGLPCSEQQVKRVSELAQNKGTLKEVEAVMQTYTAMGIMEYWDLSMQLFDAKVKSPVRVWNEEKHANQGDPSPLRDEVYRWAHKSPEIHAILSTDLLLYTYALSLFKLQTNETLGTQWVQ